MERTLVSVNFPNIITIGLIGLGWIVAIGLFKQVFLGGGTAKAGQTGGF